MQGGSIATFNMPCWYYDKKELRHTPSVNQGLSQDEESKYRREGARFILQLGNKMGLRYETMATGVVYFHRFYMIHAFQLFPRYVTSCCCLFLAGKVEETPKKCKDIMRHAKALLDDATWLEFGTDAREEVMTLERIILQTIKFNFIVEHPYTYLLKYAKGLKGDKKKLQSMVQMAWTFVNDGLCTTLCLQWEPEIIAIALMYLAGKLNKFDVTEWQGKTSKHNKWWDVYVVGISMELLEDICHQVLDLYGPKSENIGEGASAETAAASAFPAAAKIMPRVSTEVLVPKASDTPAKVSPSGPPPAKKHKKEECPVAPSPTKSDPPAVTQPYQYPPQYQYANYPPNYPPPTTSTGTGTGSPVSVRFPYPYTATSSQHPPLPITPTAIPLTTFSSSQGGNNRYPPTTSDSPIPPLAPRFSYPPPPTVRAPPSYPPSVTHHNRLPPPPPFGATSSSYFGQSTTGGNYQQPSSGSFSTPPTESGRHC